MYACMKINHDLSLLSVWYLTFYCDPRLQEIVVVKILMEGISTTAGLYSGLFIRLGLDNFFGVIKILMTGISTMAVLYSGLDNFCTMTSKISFQNILSTMFILRRILTKQMWTITRSLSPAFGIMMSPMYSGTYKIL